MAGSLTLLDLKRLEVARALALRPRLLLLDEVAAGLVGAETDHDTAQWADGGLECIRVTGVCGIVGAPPPDTEVTLDVHSIIWGRTIRGIVLGDSMPDIFIPQLIDLYLQGRLPFDKLITYYKLEEINTAADLSQAGDVLKPVLIFP